MTKKMKKIIQTKIFLFDTTKEYKDPKEDLEKIQNQINQWCWDNDIENDDDTIMASEFGDGYYAVVLTYSKIKKVDVPQSLKTV